MENTWTTRKVDELGRIVIPKGIRDKLNIKEDEKVEVFLKGSSVILQKGRKECIFCGRNTKDEFIKFNEKIICPNCANELKLIISKF